MAKGLSSRSRLIGGALLAVLVALGVGYLIGARTTASYYLVQFAKYTPLQEQDEQYPLIAPLLGFRSPEANVLGAYNSLNDAIEGDISIAQAAGGINRASVYFRDLNSSQWIGINQDADYYPASLLKVPVMIAYYKEAEQNPSLLDEQITYENVSMGDPFDAPSDLTPGQSYSIDDLINAMIINSDNGATLTLLAHTDLNTLNDVYANLGIATPGPDSAAYQISTRTYALFFRILYNATYLSPAYSQKALELLSRATFAQGLVAGLPAGAKVAHKFGEHILNVGDTATGVELHDCGVIYYPGHPYLLCVMTSAKDIPTASSLIAQISQTTYAAVAREYPAATSGK